MTKRTDSSITTKQRRASLSQWLCSALGIGSQGAKQGRSLRLEGLEPRQLLAGDVDLLATNTSEPSTDQSALFSTDSLVAEGEATDDLVAFAQQLTDAGVRFFHSESCPICTAQKQLFQDGVNYLNLVSAANIDGTVNSVGQAEGISAFPTWEFSDGSRFVGQLTLAQIVANEPTISAIPQGQTPSFVPVGDQSVAISSPLHIPIDAYDPDGQPLTVTVTSSDPTLLEASVTSSSNQSLRLSVDRYGDMVFELFEERAPRPTERIISLTNSGFYDGLTFHRIIDNFVIQGGDPNGNGTGGSTLPDIDDQFHVDLQHNSTGLLSYAKSSDDTNNSQFFVTEGPQRSLDFNHSIFGQLVEGEDVREALSELGSSRPFGDVVINDAQIFTDSENSVILLKALGNSTGTATVTITVTDADGNSSQEIISVDVVEDTVNIRALDSAGQVVRDIHQSTPFLNDIAPVTGVEGEAITFQLTSQDVEGDPVTYISFNPISSTSADFVNYTHSVDQATGIVTVIPPAGFVGDLDIGVGVHAASLQAFEENLDLQSLAITVEASDLAAPTGIDLISSSDSGSSSADNTTNNSALTFSVSGTEIGATVELLVGGVIQETLIATSSTTQISTTLTSTNGQFSFSARQRSGDLTSEATAPLVVTVDSTAPDSTTLSIPTAPARVGTEYVFDLNHGEEGAGITYALVSAPTGSTIDASTGLFTWTPTASDVGTQQFSVRITDLAGNSSTRDVSIDVVDDATAARVTFQPRITDLAGNDLNQLEVGQEFLLVIEANDSNLFRPNGVFSAYLDVLYDGSLAEPSGTSPITYNTGSTIQRGDITTPGIFDELGAVTGVDESAIGAQFDLVTVQMRALQPGQLTFSTDPADSDGLDVSVFSIDTPLEIDQLAFGSASINISSSFTLTDDILNVTEDTVNNRLDVLANDNDIAGTGLTIVSTSAPIQGGVVEIVEGGAAIAYTPAPNFFEVDQFTYTVRDAQGAEQTATATVQVTNLNDPPTAVDDVFDEIPASTQDNLSIDNFLEVIANDSSDPDPTETIRIVEVQANTDQGGTVRIGGGSEHVLYTPAIGFEGADTFTYTIEDAGGLRATATVTVNVEVRNPPPVAVSDTLTVQEDSAPTNVDVIANDTTTTGDDISLIAIVSTSNGGIAQIDTTTGEIAYEPASDFFGTETVIYTIRDSGGGIGQPASANGTLVVTVEAVNDAPVAVPDIIDVAKSAAATTIPVVANDTSGVDAAEVLTITSVEDTDLNGTVTISSDGQSLIYTPDGVFVGQETIPYTIQDPGGLTSTTSLIIDVLDFAPRDFEVQFDFAFTGLGAIPVTLTGTTDFGESVNVETVIGADGMVRFADQAPGTYQIVVAPIPFLVGGDEAQTIDIASAAGDGDSTGHTVSLGAVKAEFIRVSDWFSSTSRENVIYSIVEDGSDAIANLEAEDIPDLNSPTFSLSADGQELRIEATNAAGEVVESTLSVDDPAVRLDGIAETGLKLFRVNTPAISQFQTVSAASTLTAEGEAGSALAASSEPIVVNNLSGNANSAIVLPTGSGDGIFVEADDEDELNDGLPLPEGESTASIDSSVSQISSAPSTALASQVEEEDADENEADSVEEASDILFSNLGR